MPASSRPASPDTPLRRRKDAEYRIAARAERDPDFLSALLRQPADVLGREFGLPIPDGMTVTVIAESPGEIILVLPAAGSPPFDTHELSPSDLDCVSGGDGGEDPEDDW